MSGPNCSMLPTLSEADTTNCTAIGALLDQLQNSTCSEELVYLQQQYNLSNCSMESPPIDYSSLDKGVTLLVIFVLALIGNILTIAILSKFKVHKIPDVLVIGLALTDLLATLVPVPMSIYVYFSGFRYEKGTIGCNLYGTLAQFTRYSSALIVTLIAVERYFAINRPFIYRKYATPRKFVFILIGCWVIAFALAVAPALDTSTDIIPHGGICLFDFVTPYAISITIYAGIQFVIVFVCYVLITIQLLKVYRRRKKMGVQEKYNRRSEDRMRERDEQIRFTKPNLSSRISDLGKSIKKAAPRITEKFQLGVEAQFARMLFVVVLLFYMSWTLTVGIIIVALVRNNGENLEEILFWGIRLTVISTALNPIVYGLLARQYRLAYAYVIRLWASSCCKCVDPPLKDVFAAARNTGQEQRTYTRNNSRTMQTSHDGSMLMSRNSEIPILTSAHIGATTFHDELETIHEEEYISSAIDSTIMAEHSTFIPSAGELASTVIIPIQARDGCIEENNLKFASTSKQRSASLHDIMDSDTFLGETSEPQPGVENPLTAMGMFSDFSGSDGDGTERAMSDIEMEEGRAGLTRAFNNPAYDIQNTTGQPATPPPMIAASSTDDIILLSKKDKISPRRQGAELKGRDLFVRESSPSAHSKKKRKFDLSSGSSNGHAKIRARHSSSPPAVSRKESFTAEGLVTNIDDFMDESRMPNRNKSASDGMGRDRIGKPRMRKRGHQSEQAWSHEVLDAPERNELRELSPHHLSSDEQGRRSTSLPPPSLTGVQELKNKFESLSSSSPTPPITPEDAVVMSSQQPMTSSGKATETESGTGIRIGRRNSNGNSDSGRESMIMDSEPIQPAV